jgi:hypothetical protein
MNDETPKDNRVEVLSSRFSNRESNKAKPRGTQSKDQKSAKTEENTKTRKLRSIYLETALLDKFDATHNEISHELFPLKISKARLMEALIECGMNHLDEVKVMLQQDPK